MVIEKAPNPRRPFGKKAVLRPATLQIERGYAPSLLRGSYESLVRQNEKTEADGLLRIEDDSDLDALIAHKQLVSVPVSATLAVDPDLPENRRYCRPWTAAFLTDLARAHGAQFHRSLEVSSAVRTVAYQKQLRHINGNAAAAEGDVASPHLTGASIDIAKKDLNQQELSWMRAWLLPLEQAGKLDVEEEFKQACFHITVYKSYLPPQPSPSVNPGSQGLASTGGASAQEPEKQHKCFLFFWCD